MKSVAIDPYIHSTLMRDLVAHDHKPAAFLIYLWIYAEQVTRKQPVEISYATLAEETGLSRSAAQAAVAWLVRRKLLAAKKATPTATPVYAALTPWIR